MRRVASAILLGAVGFVLGAITLGIPTAFVYFLGSWIGAPLGAAIGAWIGARTPLRDALILTAGYFAIFALGTSRFPKIMSEDTEAFIGKVLVWAVVVGPIGVGIPLCLVRILTFPVRRIVAMVLAGGLSIALAVYTYLCLWVWVPGG